MNKILIISSNPYPNGFAVANRITTIAKGLIFNGFNIEVIVNRKTERINAIINESAGDNKGIKFRNIFKSNVRISNKYLNFISQYFGGFLIGMEIIKNKNNLISVIVYDQSLSKELFAIMICKLFSIQIWKDESEFPEVYFWKGGFFRGILKYFYLKFVYSFYSGIISITKKLDDYLKTNFNKNTSLINMMVDFERFENESINFNKPNFPYICYAGSINYKKDGINILIEVFSELTKNYPDLRLILIGSLAENFELGLTPASFNERLKKLNIIDKVVQLGTIKNDLIPSYFKNAKILALPRPRSAQAENGFPTKLGEYLASKTPVVCTSVGEIPNYLTTDFDCILVEPGNKEQVLQAFKRILNDEMFAIKITENGYQTAKKYFNYEINLKSFSERLSFAK